MSLNTKIKKDEDRAYIARQYSLSPRTRAIFLVDISDKEILKFLLQAAQKIGFSIVSLQESHDTSHIAGFDGVITDDKSSLDIVSLMGFGVVPILPKTHPRIRSFSEFDPMKFEGNAFIFEQEESFLILEKIIRFLENIRYPGDKRTLLNNVIKTSAS